MATEQCFLLQVYQQTTLFLRGKAGVMRKCTVRLDRVAINHRSIESSIVCVQSSVQASMFTQRNFFPDNGICMLTCTIPAVANNCEEWSYKPRDIVLPDGNDAVVGT